MPYLIALWFTVSTIVARGTYYDLKDEKSTVYLFEQTDYGYRKYQVKVMR